MPNNLKSNNKIKSSHMMIVTMTTTTKFIHSNALTERLWYSTESNKPKHEEWQQKMSNEKYFYFIIRFVFSFVLCWVYYLIFDHLDFSVFHSFLSHAHTYINFVSLSEFGEQNIVTTTNKIELKRNLCFLYAQLQIFI